MSKLLLFIPVIVVLFFIKFLLKLNSNHTLVMLNIIVFTILFIYISNFIILFIFLEFYSIIFYFYLLQYSKFEMITLIKYKNNLLLYLFNNFIISILFMFAIAHLLYNYGTVQFTELSFFHNTQNIYLISILLSIIVKLSLPGFHFLKIEMYKYLTLDNVIIFSVITLFVNFLLINFLLNINLVANVFSSYRILNLILILSILILIQKLKINTFQEFIAYSGFATNNLIILNFIV